MVGSALKKRVSALVLAASLFASRGFCADVPQWSVQHWTTEHGLPQNTVVGLAQSKEGYIWLATRDGLARFDGISFTTLVRELFVTEPGDAAVLQLCVDEREGVWSRTKVGFFWHGHNSIQRYPFRAGPWPDELLFMVPARGGGVWLATRTGLLLFRDGKVVERWDQEHGLPCAGVDSIHWDAEDHLWIKRELHLWRFDGKQFTPAAALLGSNITSWATCFETPERAWFGNAGRLDMWEKGRWITYGAGHGIPPNANVSMMRVDSAGRRWIKPEHGLLLWDGEHFNRISGTDLLPETDIRSWMEDQDGGIWIGTGRGGVYRLQEKTIRVLDQKTGLNTSSVHTVCEGQTGRLWVGGLVGLSSMHRGEVQGFKTSDPSMGNNFTSVIEDRRGQVWVGLQDSALFQLKEGVFVPETLPGTNSAGLKVTSLYEDHSGRLWIGTTEGLFCRKDASIRRFGEGDGLSDSFIRGIAENAGGTLWVGTARGGLHTLDGDRFKRCANNDGFSETDTRPLHAEADQTVWFGSPAGLHRLRNGKTRTVTMQQGLVDSETLALLDDGLGNFWFSCHRGIYRVAKSELHAVADGRIGKLNYSLYGPTDGLAGTECSGTTQPCAWKLADGRLGFATTRGLAIFSPAELAQHEKPPPVLIEQVKADEQVVFDGVYGRPRLDSSSRAQAEDRGSRETARLIGSPSSLRFRPGTAHVIEVRYTANSLAAPEKVRFQWKLDQRDREWHEAGTQRFALLQNLAPGNYTFRVRGCNHHGLWNEAGATFGFSIAPHFYETWPCVGLLTGAMLGLGLGLHLWRVRFLRRIERLEHVGAMEAERARIARDLHDDLGTALTSVALEIDLARRQSADGVAVQLGDSASRVRGLAQQMREVVWAVNPHCDTVSSVASFLEEQAGSLLRHGGLRGRFEFPEDIPPLPLDSETRHQLALGVREALTNTLRHAHATEVVLGLTLSGSQLVISVEDDGRGFNSPPNGFKPGHGLHNLRTRLEHVGGELVLAAGSKGGARVEMRVALRGSARGNGVA